MILAQNLHELDYHEQKEVNGGGVITVIVVTAVVTLVGNEVSKRTTGKDIVQHIGTGLEKVGGWIEEAGKALSGS
ncbi:MAG: hypothetical protein GX175_04655 [Halanaerobiaceae bacterium]|jgi:hypothetical protein|nr:hypothetical protein [Halanaerobiaceae bacterium]